MKTGIKQTDKDGNVTGEISPEGLMKFIEKNPPVNVDPGKQDMEAMEAKEDMQPDDVVPTDNEVPDDNKVPVDKDVIQDY